MVKKYFSVFNDGTQDLYVKDDEARAASYTPTLNAAPTTSTTTYTKDGQTVDFEVGQFARVAVTGGWDMYQLYDITNGVATWMLVENTFADHEQVYINVTVASGAPAGTTASGLVINVYYNDAATPTTTVTTDSNGMATLAVPTGYKYKLTFPTQSGCREIAAITHTAQLIERSIDVEYQVAAVVGNSEHVIAQIFNNDSAASGVVVTVTYDGSSSTATTDSTGKAAFDVPYGKTYTITVPQREDYYLVGSQYTRSFTAAQSVRATDFIYRDIIVGIYVMPADGTEYTLDEWEDAVEAGTRLNSEALYIKIATSELVSAGGTFAIEIDTLRERSYGATKKWCDNNYQFNSVPLNGNSVSQPYYYDGLTASNLIKAESVEKGAGWGVPAFDACLNESRTIGGHPCPGFLGSIGQWTVAWDARYVIDDILLSTRPNGTYLFSTLTANKWTCTQFNANYAWVWTGTANSSNKANSYIPLPFFAC